jgi:hypothetical protein
MVTAASSSSSVRRGTFMLQCGVTAHYSYQCLPAQLPKDCGTSRDWYVSTPNSVSPMLAAARAVGIRN